MKSKYCFLFAAKLLFITSLLAQNTVKSNSPIFPDENSSTMDQPKEKTILTFIWHAGDRAELLLKLSKEYTLKTGVEIQAILPPLSEDYYLRIANEFKKKGAAFDLCIFDSQSLSEFASNNHIVRLNDLLRRNSKIKVSDFDSAALRLYAEFPENSGNIFALPINQDCMGLVYRKDLLEQPEEKRSFKQKYGYDLKVPETYDQLKDIAEFFTRPGQNLYGIALYGSEDYDACTTAFNNIFWSYGAELWHPASGKVEGYVNSPEGKKALEYFQELFKYAPPGFQNSYVPEVNSAIVSGQVALGMQWYYYFKQFSDETKNTKFKLGFATLPAQKDVNGNMNRFVMVGGQGISISQYSNQKEEAWKFVEWLMSKEQQWKWVEGGGMTGLAAILKDPKFLDATPANQSFPFSMSITKDYWHLPEYPQLLQVLQKYVHGTISGKMPAKEALDGCAAEQEKILNKSGYSKRQRKLNGWRKKI